MIKHLPAGKTGEVVHYAGCLGSDYTLCGHDYAGDDSRGWSAGEVTNDPVNCPDCMAVIEHVKKILKTNGGGR